MEEEEEEEDRDGRWHEILENCNAFCINIYIPICRLSLYWLFAFLIPCACTMCFPVLDLNDPTCLYHTTAE